MDRFNFVNRDCPICFRAGTVEGSLRAGAVLTCRGCVRSFLYEPPATVARLDTSGIPQKRCQQCGALIGLRFGETCQVCIAQAEREAHAAAGRSRWAA